MNCTTVKYLRELVEGKGKIFFYNECFFLCLAFTQFASKFKPFILLFQEFV